MNVSTVFPSQPENPMSEGNVWLQGAVDGTDWHNIRTGSHGAYGTQSGFDAPPQQFGDSIAVRKGTWGPDQTVTGTFYGINPQTQGGVFEEVELLVRFQVSAGVARGYEVNWGRGGSGTAYSQVIKWNGALADFTPVDARTVAEPAIGDVYKVVVHNNGSNQPVFEIYINDVLQWTAVDTAASPWQDGSPGMGHYFQTDGSDTPLTSDYGWSAWTATDGLPDAASPQRIQVRGVGMMG